MNWSAWFANPALLAATALAVVPLLIHLLFRLRYQRVRWAAMDFLLASDQQNRRRLRLEQFLLLAMRVLLAAGVAMLIARPRVGAQLAAVAGQGEAAEHVVVLDDTYSMGEHRGGGTAFDSAVGAVGRLAEQLAEQPGRNRLTIWRTSDEGNPWLPTTTMNPERIASLRRDLAGLRPSWRVEGLASLLESIAQRQSQGANSVLHVFSDFRRRDWIAEATAPTQVRKASLSGMRIDLVHAAEGHPANLGVVKAAPRSGLLVSRVPFQFEVTVRNFGPVRATDVGIVVKLDNAPLPVRRIETIEPGRDATLDVELEFADAGIHEITVSLAEDPLPADNQRYFVVDAPARAPVLLVDDSPRRIAADFVSLALAPSPSVLTGVEPVVRGVDALNAGNLEKYRSVWLLDLAELKPEAVAELARFVENGGGLGVFCSDRSSAETLDRLFGAKGLFPSKVQAAKKLPRPKDDAEPDVRAEPRSEFRAFEGERNSYLETVRVMKHLPFEDLRPETSILLRLRDGSPLAMDRGRGRGRIVVVATTASDAWTNWPRNPSFVVGLLELQQLLCTPKTAEQEPRVGNPWKLPHDLRRYRRNVSISTPAGDGRTSIAEFSATTNGTESFVSAAPSKTPGVERLERTTQEGKTETIARPVNIDPADGDLQCVAPAELAESLKGVPYIWRSAESQVRSSDDAGSEASGAIIAMLVALLVLELAWAKRLSTAR